MKILGVLLFLAGLAVGVAYPLYGLGFSGGLIQEENIQRGEVFDAGSAGRVSHGQWVDAEVRVIRS